MSLMRFMRLIYHITSQGLVISSNWTANPQAAGYPAGRVVETQNPCKTIVFPMSRWNATGKGERDLESVSQKQLETIGKHRTPLGTHSKTNEHHRKTSNYGKHLGNHREIIGTIGKLWDIIGTELNTIGKPLETIGKLLEIQRFATAQKPMQKPL